MTHLAWKISFRSILPRNGHVPFHHHIDTIKSPNRTPKAADEQNGTNRSMNIQPFERSNGHQAAYISTTMTALENTSLAAETALKMNDWLNI